MGDLVMSGWCLALSNERLKLKQMFEPTRPGVLKNQAVWRKQSRAAPVPERRTSTPVETVLRDGSLGRTIRGWDMTLASDQTSPSRRKGRRLCGAKTRAGGSCQVRAEPDKARETFR
jgi:hypothetical protein